MHLFYHKSALEHDAGPGHPEASVRIDYVLQALDEVTIEGLAWKEARRAEIADIERIHPRAFIDSVFARMPSEGYVSLDGDTTLSPGSKEAALRCVGGVCAGVDAVMAGVTKRGFNLMRPPGHHAEPDRAMGFCIFNSVAVGAMRARAVHNIRKIAIIDFDVHHGNGTQAAFWNDPDTLYVSFHQWPLYPGTGAANERGAHDNILNLPMPPGTGSNPWREEIRTFAMPKLEAFAPELVMLSSGFDAHAHDPLANFNLSEDDFTWVTEAMVGLADRHAEGRVVSVLEGGYHPPALARSVIAHLRALND